MKSDSDGPRIGIISPYTGSNLGDGATQNAVIENLRDRLPRAQFVLFSLDPGRTSELHGIESFPVTGMILSYYSNTLKPPPAVSSGNDRSKIEPSLWRRLKSQPKLKQWFRPTWLRLKLLVIIPVNLIRELRYLLRARKVVGNLDLLVVSGGGQIDDHWGGPIGHTYSIFRLALLARLAGVPFVVLSVGLCSLHSQISIFLTAKTLETARLRSFRDSGTKKMLGAINPSDDDWVTADLAFSYPKSLLPELPKRTREMPPRRVGVSPIAYMHPEHWPHSNSQVHTRYAECMLAFLSHLLSEGYDVVLFATDAPDYHIIDWLVAKIQSHTPQSSARATLSHVKLDSAAKLLEEMSGMDVVVASRFHGIVLAHLLTKPTVAVSYDRKVEQHMLDMEQSVLCLDIHAVDTASLCAAFDQAARDLDLISAQIADRTTQYRQRLEEQYDRLSEIAKTRK